MHYSESAPNPLQEMNTPTCPPPKAPRVSPIESRLPKNHETLAIALYMLDYGDAMGADQLLTAATAEDPGDPKLWLAAGICRMRRGAMRSASAAFEMAAWLSDDGDARALHDLCDLMGF